jgi:homoserine kinase
MPHLPINDVAIVLQCIVSGSGPSMFTHHSNKHEKRMKFK